MATENQVLTFCLPLPEVRETKTFGHPSFQAGKCDDAGVILNDALSEHDRSPRFLKRRNFRRAMQAKGMLKALGNPA